MKRNSFTLIEIILVAIIISILIVLFIPNFRNTYQRLRLEFFAQKVMSFCRTAQEYSVTRGKHTIVKIMPKESKLVVKFPSNKMKELKIPNEFKIETDMLRLIFSGFGGMMICDAVNKGEKDRVRVNGHLKLIDKHGREVEIDFYSSGSIVFKNEVY